MYIINFLKCMDPKLLIKNKKAFQMAFSTIITIVIALALLIWYFFYSKGIGERGVAGVDVFKDVIKGRG